MSSSLSDSVGGQERQRTTAEKREKVCQDMCNLINSSWISPWEYVSAQLPANQHTQDIMGSSLKGACIRVQVIVLENKK